MRPGIKTALTEFTGLELDMLEEAVNQYINMAEQFFSQQLDERGRAKLNAARDLRIEITREQAHWTTERRPLP